MVVDLGRIIKFSAALAKCIASAFFLPLITVYDHHNISVANPHLSGGRNAP